VALYTGPAALMRGALGIFSRRSASPSSTNRSNRVPLDVENARLRKELEKKHQEITRLRVAERENLQLREELKRLRVECDRMRLMSEPSTPTADTRSDGPPRVHTELPHALHRMMQKPTTAQPQAPPGMPPRPVSQQPAQNRRASAPPLNRAATISMGALPSSATVGKMANAARVGMPAAEKEKLMRAAITMRDGGLPVIVLLNSGFGPEVLLASGAATAAELRAAGVDQSDLEDCESFIKEKEEPPPEGKVGPGFRVPLLDMVAARMARSRE